MKHPIIKISLLASVFVCAAITYTSAQTPTLTLDFTKPGANVSPMLYGLMTEEINHAYDGGLYPELIRNRIFKDNKSNPDGWSLVRNDSASKANIKLMAAAGQENIPFDERRHAITGALTTCLRLTVEKTGGRIGIANEGFWGIPVTPATTYHASFYSKGSGSVQPQRRGGQAAPPNPAPVIDDNTPGPVTVTIESTDGKTVYASGTINLEKSILWKKYELTLTTGANIQPTCNCF